ncbi:hypothetical protein WN093_07150 [Gammaproteobacteria bacterium AS21]|jgi:hypothetical protein
MKSVIKKSMTLGLTIIASSFLLMASASAHDASMHKKKNAEQPKCDAMAKMDHAKMDMNDPIMQAMMAQCMSNESASTGQATAHAAEQASKHGDSGHSN